MYITGMTQQLRVFILSVSLGFLLGFLYDSFRLIRIIFKKSFGKASVFAQDVIFILLCGIITFLFLLSENYGEIRLYVLLGEICGFFVYYFTIGVLVVKFSDLLAKNFHKAVSFLKRMLLKPLSAFKRCLKRMNLKIKEKAAKNTSNNLKISLKLDRSMRYNINDKLHLCVKRRKRGGNRESEIDE